MKTLQIKRTRHRLLPDSRRVLAKPFLPGDESLLPGASRAQLLMARILTIPEADVKTLSREVLERFEARHRSFDQILERHFELVVHQIPPGTKLSPERRLLIGAYFSHEYSVEAAALFGPSIVLAPDQGGAPAGGMRFIMSLRAVGEGHLSSIEFRTGSLDAHAEMSIDPPSVLVVGGRRTSPASFNKRHFATKLEELGACNPLSVAVLMSLADAFTLEQLEASIEAVESQGSHAISFETIKIIRALSSSNYVTTFPSESELS